MRTIKTTSTAPGEAAPAAASSFSRIHAHVHTHSYKGTDRQTSTLPPSLPTSPRDRISNVESGGARRRRRRRRKGEKVVYVPRADVEADEDGGCCWKLSSSSSSPPRLDIAPASAPSVHRIILLTFTITYHRIPPHKLLLILLVSDSSLSRP